MATPLITFPAGSTVPELVAMRDELLTDGDWTSEEATEIRGMFDLHISSVEIMDRTLQAESR